jgi:biotin transport system permease protein
MVELNLFHYWPRHSPLHRMDARLKVVGVALLSVAVGLADSIAGFGLITVFLVSAVFLAQLPFRALIRELRRFAFLIMATIAVQVLGQTGTPTISWLPGISLTGLVVGLRLAWRLGAVLVIGLLLTGTTQLTELRAAVYWLLRPLSSGAAARIATMFSLTLTLIPLILDQAATIGEAQQSRGIELVKNPFRRLRCLAWPVLRETFRRADELILAMESRCYSEERTQPVFSGAPVDLGVFGLILAVLGLVVWL